MVSAGLVSVLRVLRSYHFWVVVALFALLALCHYPQQLLQREFPDLALLVGLTRHSLDRVLLLIPIIYASFVFGVRGGITSMAAAYAIMLPRAILLSAFPRDALLESIGVLATGSLVNVWFYMYRRIITERKEAEESLRESERNYRDFFESAPDAIWVHDMDGNIKFANEAASRLVGYPVDELCRSKITLFLNEETIKVAREVKVRLLQHQPVNLPYEQAIVKRDGTEATCIVTTNLIMADGKPRAFQNIATDKRLYEDLRYYLKEITRAQEEERKRIARDLHDSTAQTLIALLHKLENFLNEESKLPVKEAMSIWAFHEQIRDVLHEVRRFSRDLRPSILDDLGLLPALEWFIGELRDEYGIYAALKVQGSRRRLAPETELMLFRIVQEALRNTAKHAEATKAEVAIGFSDKGIRVAISDNGTGFSLPENLSALPQIGKLGLTGMQERAQLLGGTFNIKSEPGKGTVITVEVPV